MRIQYMFWLDEYVGREECAIRPGMTARESACMDLGPQLFDYDYAEWTRWAIIGEPKRIPVAEWDNDDSWKGRGACLYISDDRMVYASESAMGLAFEWEVRSRTPRDGTVCIAEGTADTLEAAQLAAEDAIVRMGQEFLRVGGGA